MTTLAFDTATRATTVALDAAGEAVLEARDDPPANQRARHATTLLPLAGELLEQTGRRFEDLDRIAVGLGPGSFTGLRIGIATARALASALGIRVVGVPTLQSLALNARSWPQLERFEAVAAVLDARRGEVFAAVWETPGLEARSALIPAGAYAPELLAERLARLGASCLAIGDGAVEFRGPLERSGALVPDERAEIHRVSAASHCRIARHLRAVDPDRILPEYLRAPDVKEPSPQRAAGNR
jgi:tRNA threonylcarbamoyladenosine biosynthesis protein TsaB